MNSLKQFNLLIGLFSILCSFRAYSEVILALQESSYNLETKDGETTVSSKASVAQNEVFIGYNHFISSKIAIEPQLYFSYKGDIYSSGMAAVGKYYFLGGNGINTKLDENIVILKPMWSAHIGLGLHRITLNADIASIAYFGYGAELGIERYLTKNFSAFFRVISKSLASDKNRTLSSNSYIIGTGIDF